MGCGMGIFYYIKTWFRIVSSYFSFKDAKTCRVMHKSDNYVIVDKTFDMKINSNNKYETTVQTFMKSKFPGLASHCLFHEFYFMHRLDFATSGLMCIPVHKKACQVASKAFQTRNCKKYYVALVRGYFSKSLLDLSLPIGRDEKVQEIEKMCVSSNSSRNARTIILVLEEGLYENYPCTKILVRPITGRRHQIRVHCAHIGHTIIGDYTYSNKKDVKPFRMFLHSLRLIIPNELENFDVETPDPFTEFNIKDWKSVIRYNTLNEAFVIVDK